MNGLNFLLVALLVLVVIYLVWNNQKSGGNSEASFTISEIFSATIKLTSNERNGAGKSIQDAAVARGQTQPGPAEHFMGPAIGLARVLWVDDNPDDNIFETLALEQVGRFITKATTTDSALLYFERLRFDLVITDLNRDGNPDAGLDLVERLSQRYDSAPVIVYTADAGANRNRLLDAGAWDITDTPDSLLSAVEGCLDGRRRRS